MPESTPGRAPGGAGNRAKGAYQDRDKPAQIRFSNIAAGKGAAAARGPPRGRGEPGRAPRGPRLGRGAMDPPVLGTAPGCVPGIGAGMPCVWWLGAPRDGPARVGDAVLGADTSPGRTACCVLFLCDCPDLKWLQSSDQILIA